MTTYHVRAERAEKYWAVCVVELDRWTQGRTVVEIDSMARDLIAIITEEDPETIEIQTEIVLPALARQHLQSAEEMRRQAFAANRDAARESRAAARALREAGLGLKDIGAVLGVSYQRASQLVADRG